MELSIVVSGKKYDIVDKVSIDGKNYIAYEDEDTIYINAYNIENNKLVLLGITNEEKEKVIKTLEL